MIKKVLAILLGFTLIFLFSKEAWAEGEFKTATSISYVVNENGITTVSHKISIENLFTQLYAIQYKLKLENSQITEPKASQKDKPLNLLSKTDGSSTELTIEFPDQLVGKGEKRDFEITYMDNKIATKTGEVWEISIPRTFKSTQEETSIAALWVPKSFGNPAYISPTPKDVVDTESMKVFLFDKNSNSGINAAFGQFQTFSFDLKYHLENPIKRNGYIDIAIPPDTAYQRVIYSDFAPLPQEVYVDSDGNWIARILLRSRERIDLSVKGHVQIYPGAREVPRTSPSILEDNLKETKFWQVNDAQIREIAKTLNSPKEIYDYVVNTLTYDYQRVSPTVERFGAKKALNNPNNAICMEFTDLFIALARAGGIPAREINGYAYSENPELEPLGLVADVLHSWPEYWDREKGLWVPVDPTWGSTTGGVDYFSKLDLRHFAFVIHGADSEKPYPPGSYKLGPNPQKDVFVSFGSNQIAKYENVDIAIDPIDKYFLKNLKLKIRAKNNGNVAIYGANLKVYLDSQETVNKTLEIIPPYGIHEEVVIIPITPLFWEIPRFIKVSILNKEMEIATFPNQLILNLLFVVISLIFVLVLGVYFWIKRINPFSLIYAKFAGLRQKFSKRAT